MAGKWMPIESAPAEGVILVYLEAPMTGSRIHCARWHPNIKTIGAIFSFDAPKATHWMPLPEPPESATQPLPPPNEE